jgi:coproporphyrinogen III oxidase-like Fe-S oxidoreductase
MRVASVYLHVPFCRLRCPFCKWADRTRRPTAAAVARFVDRLAEDVACFDFADREVQGIAVGGGTPSLLTPGQLEAVLTAVLRRLPAGARLRETSVEVHPRDGDPATLAGYRSAGVDRLSIGAQSFDEASLAVLGRAYGRREVLATVDAARSAGFENLNVDLLFGFPAAPGAVPLVGDVQQAIALGIEHVTLAPFDDRYPAFARWERSSARRGRRRPPREELHAVTAEAIDLLEANGYARSHSLCFARPGRDFHYERTLFERTGDVVAFGPGTVSYLGDQVVRVGLDVDAYLAGRGAATGPSGLACGDFFFLSLQARQGFSRRRFAEAFGLEFEEFLGRDPALARTLAELTGRGALEDDGEAIRRRDR